MVSPALSSAEVLSSASEYNILGFLAPHELIPSKTSLMSGTRSQTNFLVRLSFASLDVLIAPQSDAIVYSRYIS